MEMITNFTGGIVYSESGLFSMIFSEPKTSSYSIIYILVPCALIVISGDQAQDQEPGYLSIRRLIGLILKTFLN